MAQDFGKGQWVELFRQAGLDEKMMEKWHRLFEAEYPQAHQGFLEWLKLSAAEIATLRRRFS
jgi:hypothetical protein